MFLIGPNEVSRRLEAFMLNISRRHMMENKFLSFQNPYKAGASKRVRERKYACGWID